MISRIRHYVTEHQNEWDTFIFSLTYACNITVPRTTKLALLSLAVTPVPHGSIVARPMTPDVGNIDSQFVYRLPLSHKAALLNKMADPSPRKGQALYKKDYDEQVRFEPRFAAVDYVFVECPLLIASATDHMAFWGYWKLLPRRMWPYQVICVWPQYAKIDQDVIQNTVSTNRLGRVDRKRRLNEDSTSDSRTAAGIKSAKKSPTKEEKNYYTAEKVVGHEDELKGHTTLLADMAKNNMTTQSSRRSTFSIAFGKHTGEEFERVNRNQNIQWEKGLLLIKRQVKWKPQEKP